MNQFDLNNARIVWQYMQLNQPLQLADCLVVLGSRDDRVARYAADLMLGSTYAQVPAIVTGGAAHANDLLATHWPEATEADHFAAIMIDAGVAADRLILEKQATNTGQNANYSYKLVKAWPDPPRSLLVITKPYMERRAYATFKAQWPDNLTDIRVSSVGGSLDDYINDEQSLEQVTNIMVGDLERIIKYPLRGWQIVQPIPRLVQKAATELKRAGFSAHLTS